MSDFLTVDTNAQDVSLFMRRFFQDQIPFATSVALNQTARDIRTEMREGIAERFTVRDPKFVLSGTRFNFSTKRNLETIVSIDRDRRFLFKFEEGGTTRPKGRTSFAIPTQNARTSKGSVLAKLRPKALEFKHHGDGPGVQVFRGNERTFIVRRADSSGHIFQRTDKKRSVPAGLDPYVRRLFSFSKTAEVDDRLKFGSTASFVFDEKFDPNFEKAFERAIRTAR